MKYPNIVFIVIDALRARNLGCYGYHKPVSPNIDKLALNGVLFSNAFSCTPTTDPSLTSIFSGKYPTSHGILNHGFRVTGKELYELKATGTLFLPEILKSKGYVTLAIDWLGRWHRRGYDYYSYVGGWTAKLRSYVRRVLPSYLLKPMYRFYRRFRHYTRYKGDAKAVTDSAINIIRRFKNRFFFLFIHYWDTHTPYNPPHQFYKKFLEGNDCRVISDVLNEIRNSRWRNYLRYCIGDAQTVGDVIARYDGAVAFIDHEIGRLIDILNEENLLDQTLIILTSDHGESLGEHGIYFAHHGLYDVTIHVPLIIKYPHVLPSNKRVYGLVQHVDILPTILNIIRVNVPYGVDGRSLIPLINGDVESLRSTVLLEEAFVQRKRAIRTYNYKYIYTLSKEEAICRYCGQMHGDLEELYDLNKDSGETKNIANVELYIKNHLRELLLKWIEKLNRRKNAAIIKRKIKF